MAVVPGLVAAYGFNEGSGATVFDSSGNGNHGTISGATRNSSGQFGAALDFDGANDLVTVPDSNSLDLTSGMTVEARVRPLTTGATRAVLRDARFSLPLRRRLGGADHQERGLRPCSV